MVHPLRELRAEAYQILTTCTAATPRDEVAWAVGVIEIGHAIRLYNMPVNARAIGPEFHGAGPLRNPPHESRWYEGTRTSWSVFSDRTDRVVHVSGRWVEVAALMTLDRIGAELHEAIRGACHTRRDRTPSYDPRRPSGWHRTAEAELERRSYEIETECEHLKALAWEACRPQRVAAEPVQLGLFDLEAAA